MWILTIVVRMYGVTRDFDVSGNASWSWDIWALFLLHFLDLHTADGEHNEDV